MPVVYTLHFANHQKKIYVGSTCNIHKRLARHISDLKRGKHPNYKLQAFFNLYGNNRPICTILENCTLLNQFQREQFYIDLLKPALNIQQKAGQYQPKKPNPAGKFVSTIERLRGKFMKNN